MINKTLPKLEKKDFPPVIKLKDGESFQGVIVEGTKIQTKFGETYKFTFEVDGGEKRVFLNKNEFVAGKLNEFETGDLVKISRSGEGSETRWTITEGELEES